MPAFRRGQAMILWLAVAILLFSANGSAWRDLVSSPAGTIVHVSVKGGELVPWLKALTLLSMVIAIVSLFANRAVILAVSGLAGIFALAALSATLGKFGSGPVQVGVNSRFFWFPAAISLLGIFGALFLALATPLSARGWAIARYRTGEKKQAATSLDLWRAQDSGTDPTASDEIQS